MSKKTKKSYSAESVQACAEMILFSMERQFIDSGAVLLELGLFKGSHSTSILEISFH